MMKITLLQKIKSKQKEKKEKKLTGSLISAACLNTALQWESVIAVVVDIVAVCMIDKCSKV